jgi:RNA polymerase sigma-70 factor (ECF subfamily)
VSFRGTDSAASGNIIEVHSPPLRLEGDVSAPVFAEREPEPREPDPQDEPRPPPDFLAVYEELFPFVWRLARRLGVQDASLDDVCQEVFVVVHNRLDRFEGRSSIKTWVYGIANNVVLTHRRSTRRKDAHRAEVDPESVIDLAPGPLDAASGAQAARIAHALLSQLSDDKRTMLVLVELEEMSVPEAAEAVQTNLNTAYGRLRAARAEFAAAVARFHAKERRRK